MKAIYKQENPFPSVKTLEIHQPVLDDDNSYYPITVNGNSYHLKVNEEGFWEADGLSEELCLHIGEIVERNDI